MIFGLIGISVIAVALAITVLNLQRKTAGMRDLATAQSTEHAQAMDAKAHELRQLADQLRSTRGEYDTLQEANTQLSATGMGQRAEIAATHAANDTHVASLLNQIANLESAVRRAPTASPEPEALWQLELLRTERTWRHSVATHPAAESPFIVTDNPLRLAVEIEASALREDVGAFITVRWDAAKIEDPARALLVLRVAQELLAEAARDPFPIELIATSSGPDANGHREVTLAVVAPEEDNRTIVLDPPSFNSEVIDISTDEGMVVTVR